MNPLLAAILAGACVLPAADVVPAPSPASTPGLDAYGLLPPDTGWWAPLPTAECPGPTDGAVTLESLAGFLKMSWYDGNSMAWFDYVDVDFRLTNLQSDDAEGCSPGSWDIEDNGDFELNGRFHFYDLGPTDLAGHQDDPNAPLANGFVYVYTFVELFLPGTGEYIILTAPPAEASMCIEQFTPDVFRGAIYVTSDDESEPPLYFPIDIQSKTSPWWKERGTFPCMEQFYVHMHESLVWSGIWP